jgi:hypothetical protein
MRLRRKIDSAQNAAAQLDGNFENAISGFVWKGVLSFLDFIKCTYHHPEF